MDTISTGLNSCHLTYALVRYVYLLIEDAVTREGLGAYNDVKVVPGVDTPSVSSSRQT